MHLETLIDGQPVVPELAPRATSAWVVQAGDQRLVSIGAADLPAETVADLAARETGCDRIEVEALHCGFLALAAEQPGFWHAFTADGTRLTHTGHMARLHADPADLWPAPAPTHTGGTLAHGQNAPEPVTTLRVHWADGRQWLIVLPELCCPEAVREILADTHPDMPFTLGRVDAGCFALDPQDGVPDGYTCFLAARPAPAAGTN